MNILRINDRNELEEVQARNITHAYGNWYISKANNYGERHIYILVEQIDCLVQEMYRSFGRDCPDTDFINKLIEMLKPINNEMTGGISALELNGDFVVNRILKACENGQWTNLLDIEIIRRSKGGEAAEKIKANRDRIRSERVDKEAREVAAREQARKIQEENESKKLADDVSKAIKNLKNDTKRDGTAISGEEFLLLAKTHGVALPIKFIGWAKEKLYSLSLPEEGKLFVPYRFIKSQSKSLNELALKVFESVGIKIMSDAEKESLAEEKRIQAEEKVKSDAKVALIPKRLQRAIKYYADCPKTKEYEIHWDDRVLYKKEITKISDSIFKYKNELYKIVTTYGKGSNVLSVNIKWFDFDSFKIESILAGNPWYKQDLVDKINACLSVG